MLSYDMFRYDKDTNEKMKDILLEKRQFLTKIIKNGQNSDEFNRGIKCEDAVDIILGILWSFTYNRKLSDCSYSLKGKVCSSP